MIVNTLVRAVKQSGTHPKDPALASLYAPPVLKSGVAVSEQNALTFGAVWACTRVLSESLASLPLPVLSDSGEGVTSKAYDHPVYRILHDRPNRSMSSFIFRETVQGYVCLTGNGVSIIDRARNGSGAALHPYPTNRVRVDEDRAGNLIYEFDRTNETTLVRSEADVLHIRGFSPDGIWGYSPVRVMRELIGLGLATELYAASVYGARSMPGGHYEVPWVMDEDEFENFKRKIGAYAGPDGWNHNMVLEKGIKFVADMMPPEDAQWAIARAGNDKAIARIYRVPPHMIGILDDATYSNIEQESLNYVIYSLRPWLVRWEQEINEKLFVPSQRGHFYAEFNVDGLLRGDAVARANANQIKFMNGALNIDEWRAQDNDNPLPDGAGQRHFVPANLVPLDGLGREEDSGDADTLGEVEPEESEDDIQDDAEQDGEGDERSAPAGDAYRLVWESAIEQLLTKEAKMIRRAARGQASDAEVADWLDEFYADHRGAVVRLLSPILRSIDAGRGDAYLENFASRYASVGARELREFALSADDPWARVRDGLEQWINKRRAELLGAEYAEAVAALTGDN